MKSNGLSSNVDAEISENNGSNECLPLEKETRFAVVMYGGVSLAIYIYGIAKKLYSMVRATARQVDNENRYLLRTDELSATEKFIAALGRSCAPGLS